MATTNTTISLDIIQYGKYSLIGCIDSGHGISPQGYNVAPSTLAYFPASMETNIPVCYKLYQMIKILQ